MKKYLLLILFPASFIVAQNGVIINPGNYASLKQNGKLDPAVHYQVISEKKGVETVTAKLNPGTPSTQTSSGCGCFIPLDTTFTVAEFTDGTAPDYRGDDGSTPVKILPFNFCFYGTNYNSVYINRNGNVSFVNSSSVYSSTGFPNSTDKMIAPFWADVDTRDTSSGLVYYKINPTSMIVKWENVGYYNTHSNSLNNFQLILTDGIDSLLPAGNNVAFCYGDMQWTAGDASQGINGLGGIAATVGANKSNGSNFFQVGRFDSTGTTFDGPSGANDGVDFLDDQSIYLNTCNTANIPPIILTYAICDTIDVYTGDTLIRSMAVDSITFTVSASPVLVGNTVTTSLSGSVPAHFTYDTISYSPSYQVYSCTFVTSSLPPGLYHVDITATDNNSGAQSTRQVIVRSNFDATAGIAGNKDLPQPKLYPNPANEAFIVENPFENTKTNLIIRSVLGETVMNFQLSSKQQNIDISVLSKGVYFVTLTSEKDKSRTIKLLKE